MELHASLKNNKMILEHYDNVREFDQIVQQEARAKSRGISDEQINSLANSSLVPIDDIRAMADWTVPKLKDELKKRGAQISSGTKEPKILSTLVHALMLERQRAGRVGRIGRTRFRKYVNRIGPLPSRCQLSHCICRFWNHP